MVVNILVVCTANQCRSPMAAAILHRELTRRGVQAQIRSAGTSVVGSAPATHDAIVVMKAEGLDISTHRSRPVEPNDIDRSDIIITMTRAQLRYVATKSPESFSRLFTLKELARRAREHGRVDGEDLGAWIAQLGAGRRTTDLLGDDPVDDVEDPIGCPIEVYSAVVRELAHAISSVVDAGWARGRDGV
jgi:protein-tyrosine phosphatase